LTEAGYIVTLQNVPFDVSYVTTPRVFEQKSPTQKIYEDNIDYAPLVNSGKGDVTAKVQTPPGNIGGCNANDFLGFNSRNIALVQYDGKCSGRNKVENAIAAGATAVIIFNNTSGIFFAQLAGSAPSKTTPVVFASQELGDELKTQIQTGVQPTVHIKFDAIKTITNSQNIIAESSTGNSDHVVIAGAHLDSSAGSSGMNDNASAAATILETALLMKNTKPVNKLRFAWWTGEEEGLLGSTYYINHLDDKEKAKISLYLNYEILGAPNGGRMIMGAADGVTPPGSEKIVKLYTDYFNSQNLKSYVFDPKMANAVARSDMFAFMQAGIPVGYLVSGAEIPWNPLLTAIFTDLPKRVEGLATHPCYHKLCDKLTLIDGEMQDPNFDFDLYLQMSKAAAYAIYTYSMDTNI
jgi:aminopeptidase Y